MPDLSAARTYWRGSEAEVVGRLLYSLTGNGRYSGEFDLHNKPLNASASMVMMPGKAITGEYISDASERETIVGLGTELKNQCVLTSSWSGQASRLTRYHQHSQAFPRVRKIRLLVVAYISIVRMLRMPRMLNFMHCSAAKASSLTRTTHQYLNLVVLIVDQSLKSFL